MSDLSYIARITELERKLEIATRHHESACEVIYQAALKAAAIAAITGEEHGSLFEDLDAIERLQVVSVEAVNNLAFHVEEYELPHSKEKRLCFHVAGVEVTFARDEPTKGICEAIRRAYLISVYARKNASE